MSQIEIAFGFTRKIEGLLEQYFSASGRGLHSKVDSVESRLPAPLVKRIRWIATIRNNLAHTDGFQIDNVADFSKTCESVVAELEALARENLSLVAMDTNTPATPGQAVKVYVTRTNKPLLALVFVLGLAFGAVAMWQAYAQGWASLDSGLFAAEKPESWIETPVGKDAKGKSGAKKKTYIQPDGRTWTPSDAAPAR